VEIGCVAILRLFSLLIIIDKGVSLKSAEGLGLASKMKKKRKREK